MDTGILVMVLCLFVAIGAVENRVRRAERRAARAERKLDLIVEHLGIDADGITAPTDQVRALVRDGKQVEAVKEYRKVTGAGLKEAKDEVDRLAAAGH